MYSYTTIASKVWIEGMLLKIGISEANIWHLGRRAARLQMSESAATTKASKAGNSNLLHPTTVGPESIHLLSAPQILVTSKTSVLALLFSNSVPKTMTMEMIDDDDAFDAGGLRMMHAEGDRSRDAKPLVVNPYLDSRVKFPPSLHSQDNCALANIQLCSDTCFYIFQGTWLA